MRRSHFASFLSAVFWLVARALDHVVRMNFVESKVHLDLDIAARTHTAEPAGKRFKAFMARAFTHDRYSGGRFDLARSTPA